LAEPAVEVRGLWFGYGEGPPVLRGLDLTVARGQIVALVGANGSGKTTLCKHLNGLLRPRRGRVSVLGHDTAAASIGELARQVGYLFQNPEQQIFSASVRREIAFGPENLGLPAGEVQARVEGALARFELAALAERPPSILGYGVRRRITLASLAAMDPPILVLDEPTVGLDAAGLEEMVEWLGEVHARGRTILLVTHDMALAARLAGRMIVLEAGCVLADGPPADLFRRPEVMARASLAPPPVARLAGALAAHGLPASAVTVEAFCEAYVAAVEGRA
jgi:energy-coupling factor transport system ATP-binding protein